MLTQKIDEDLKAALKEKKEITVSALRNLKAAFKNAEIEKQHPLSDEEAQQVIAKKVKQHKDSLESFKSGNRPDLIEHESAQMAVLQEYLPAEMSEDELAAIVRQVIADLSATGKDFGRVMKEVVTRAKGAAEGNQISKLVKENLK